MRPRGVPEGTRPHDVAVTFVISEMDGDIHAFVPAFFDVRDVQTIANNFSRRVQQPVKVFRDAYREKYRLCPTAAHVVEDTISYGTFLFQCDASTQMSREREVGESSRAAQASLEPDQHIPRPKNSWILYRQAKSPQVLKDNPKITAGEISRIISKMWKDESDEVKKHYQNMAIEEDRKHKQMYPGYKYTTSKNKPA